MIKLSELEKNEFLYILLDNDDIEIMSVEDYKKSYLRKENIKHNVYTTTAHCAEINIEKIIEDIAEIQDMYEDWSEDILLDIGRENIKLINSILERSSNNYPVYFASKKIDVDN